MFDIVDSRMDSNNDYISLNLLNLFDGTDCMRDYVSKIPCSPGYVEVALHGNKTGFGAMVNAASGQVGMETRFYSPSEISDVIVDSGLWNGEPIILLSCYSGASGIESPAQTIADELGVLVFAPKADFRCNANGFYYVSDTDLSIDDPKRLPEYQRQQWAEFLPIVY